MESIKRTIRVTIEKEIEVELTPEMFSGYTVEEYVKVFSEMMWDISSVDDIAKYAAYVAADGDVGREEDGLGLVNTKGSTHPRKGDVVVDVISEDVEYEIVDT